MTRKLLYLILLCILSSWDTKDEFLIRLSRQLDNFNLNYPYQELHLSFNQDKYVPADTIFFSCYLLTDDLTFAKGKKIITLALADSKGSIIQKINFVVLNGKSNNQLVIPEKILPGHYQLVAYDPMIKSLHDPILFKQSVVITAKQKMINISRPSAKPMLFFEGGQLVSDVQNRIVIKSNPNEAGQFIGIKENLVINFVTDQAGIASVELTPKSGNEYFVQIQQDSTKHYLKMPKADGCVLRVLNSNQANTATVEVLFPPSSALLSKGSYLVITKRRKIIYSSHISLRNNKFATTVTGDPKYSGLYEAVIFDNLGIVISKRVFVIDGGKGSSVSASIIANKEKYQQQEEVKMNLNLLDGNGNPIQGVFSVSVVQHDLFFGEQNLKKNQVENFKLSQYLLDDDYSIENSTSSLNDLLITKNFFLVPWEDILVADGIAFKVPSSQLSLRGRAYFKNTMIPVPDSTLIVGYLKNALVGYETYTENNGLFDLSFLFDFWGEDRLFYLMERKGNELTEEYIIVPDEYNPKIHAIPLLSASEMPDQYGNYALSNAIVKQSYNFFSSTLASSKKSIGLNAGFEDEMMGADFSVKVSDYVAFPNMQDVIKEIVPFLEHRKKGDASNVRLLIKQKDKYRKSLGTPLFIIDGVLTKDKDFFLSLAPADVINIKIINNLNKLNQLGTIGKNGIVLVQTKKPLETKLIENRATVDVIGLSNAVSFVSPSYPKPKLERIPDLRSTLHWNPDLSTNSQGNSMISFFTSDDIGLMKVIVRGITNQGEMFKAETSFNVTFKPN
jgi:hypothetical protein